jgi:membrane-bound metal-dependent hydrolase YbcI (DUF457 family)
MSTGGLRVRRGRPSGRWARTAGAVAMFAVLNALAYALASTIQQEWASGFQYGVFAGSFVMIGVSPFSGWQVIGGTILVGTNNGRRVIHWRVVKRIALGIVLSYVLCIGAFVLFSSTFHVLVLVGILMCTVATLVLRFWIEWREQAICAP